MKNRLVTAAVAAALLSVACIPAVHAQSADLQALKAQLDALQKKVAEHYNIRLADMHSARRARAVARPRQVAMYLSKQLTARSLPEIGRKFGGRDHTTVMHAVRKVEELRVSDPSFAEDIELLRRMLEG